MSYDRSAYVWNNPLMAADPSGDIIVSMLIGAAISVITNGITNSINGRGFFEGWGQAAMIGSIGGAFSTGIGDALPGITQSLTASGMKLTSAKLVTGAFQVVMHGHLGGMMSLMNGGNYGSGFASGVAGSLVGNAGGKIFEKAGKAVKGIGTTLTGGVAGGLGSVIAGGQFWDGFRNGAISAGLNHAIHAGYFGDNLAAAAITGKLRHLWGPDAVAVSGNVIANPAAGLKLEKGRIFLLRGKGEDTSFDGVSAMVGLPSLSAETSITKLYYSGALKNININTFTGSYFELNVGIDIGLSVGGHISYSPLKAGGFVLGFGVNLGAGFNPVYGLDANFQIGTIGTKSPFFNKE